MADLASFLLTDLRGSRGAPLDEEYDRDLRRYVRECGNITNQQFNQRVDGNSLLQLLDPARNTISYLYVLLARPRKNIGEDTLFAITGFLTQFDPVQARYVGTEWRQLITWLVQIIDASHNVGYTRKRFCLSSILTGLCRLNSSFPCVLPSCAWIHRRAPLPLATFSSSNSASRQDHHD